MNSIHPHLFFLLWCAFYVISLILSSSGWVLYIRAGFPALLLSLLRVKFSLCLLRAYTAWESTRDFALTQETEDIPWIWVEYRNHRQLWSVEATMRNYYQSNATASIPYTLICMGKVIDSVWRETEWKTSVEQGSRDVSGNKHWCLGNISDKLRSAFSFLPENKQAMEQSFMNYWSFALWCCCWCNIYCLLSICFNCSACSVTGPYWQ